MERVVDANRSRPPLEIVALLRTECLAILDGDARVCAELGKRGLELLKPGMGILTHCNAGRLATASEYGTATAPIYLGHERGYGFKVYCDETRPLLQGARLTAYELCAAGVDATLICDNMAPSLMAAGRINAVLVGCDRVAANGDTANKVGTSYAAIAARHFGIPFYVCAPSSTIDFTCESGSAIVIEQRGADEVTDMWFAERVAPAGIKVFNPSFDVTGADLITAIITEFGVARPPYRESLAALTDANES
jgi:methylthioribose-1-phosphate isomerase